MSELWRTKANRVISELCLAEFNRANRLPSGKLRKRHRPYSVPEIAAELVGLLASHDHEAAELRAKQIFCWEV